MLRQRKELLVVAAVVAVVVVVLVGLGLYYWSRPAVMRRYGCDRGRCVETPDGQFTEATCQATCSPSRYYGCSNGECVAVDSVEEHGKYGTLYSSSGCDGKCGAPPYYRCAEGACVRADRDHPGSYSRPDCSDGSGETATNNCLVRSQYERLRLGDVFRCDPYNCFSFVTVAGKSAIANTITSRKTSDLVKKVANTFGISGSAPVQGVVLATTLSATTGYDTTNTFNIQTVYQDIKQISGIVTLERNSVCTERMRLDDDVRRDFENLPVVVAEPDKENSWLAYNNFLGKYGSHIITKIQYGSRFIYSESTTDESEDLVKNLEIKTCISANKDLVEVCNKYTEEEIKKASKFNSNARRFVVGGSAATNRKLFVAEPTAENYGQLLQDFLKAGEQSHEPVDVTFVPIWEFLRNSIPVRQEGPEETRDGEVLALAQRCVNLEAAFVMTALQCVERVTANGIAYKRFQLEANNPGKLRTYECWNKKTGCNEDDDCHYSWRGGCRAGGRSALDLSPVPTGNPEDNNYESVVRTEVRGDIAEGINNSCKFSGRNFKCYCDRDWPSNAPDRSVWKSEFRG